MKPVIEQRWRPVWDENGSVLIVDERAQVICEIKRPDRESSIFLAGYLIGLHMRASKEGP